MKLPKKLNNVIDFLGIIVPLVVDLVMNVISFSLLAPDTITKIAFIALAIMIVIFVPRAWSKRQYVSYAIFVIVVVFADWSFTLATTGENIKAETAVIYEDKELNRLQKNIEKSEKMIEDLHQQYYEANKRDTLAELNKQIETETARRDSYELEYKERLEQMTRKAEKNNLSADDIFNAIPLAIKNKRFIPLIIWFFVFVGVQLVVATSIDNKDAAGQVVEHKPEVKQTVTLEKLGLTEEDIKTYVHTSWYNVSNQGTNAVLSPESFFALQPSFSMKKYDIIRKLAINKRVIDQFNHALIIDETEAMEKLRC